MKKSFETIAVVTAHPDDLMPCFGTIMLSRGVFEWHVIDFTHGERGLGEAGYRDGSTAKTRMAEEDAVCTALGARHHWLDEIDGEAYACRETCRRLAALLSDIRPRAVFAHWPVDIHGDHAMAGVATLKAVFLAGLSPEIYFFEEYQSKRFQPDQFVDIMDVAERKRELIKLYACQYFGGELERVEVGLTRANGLRSALLSGDAEGFMTFVQPLQGLGPTIFQKLPPSKRATRLPFQGVKPHV
jgi:LmbE family N-acetylglucosaminyl deacetylase